LSLDDDLKKKVYDGLLELQALFKEQHK